MNSQNKKLPSWKETWQLHKRAFLLIWKHSPQTLLCRIFPAVWCALTPYVGIYLSALILEELAGNKSPQRLTRLVLITLTAGAVIGLGTALMTKWRNVQEAGSYFNVHHILTDKFLDMDFVNIDDPVIQGLYDEIKEFQNSLGWGLPFLIRNLERLVTSLFSILGGLGMTITLFTRQVPKSAGTYALLNHPLIILLVIFIMIGVSTLSPLLSARGNRYWIIDQNRTLMGRRLIEYFGVLSSGPNRALDMRIYRQERICAKYQNDKTATFSSKGPIAKLQRGPMGLYFAAASGASVLFTGAAYTFVCLKAWAGAFGIGSVTQYVASITKVAGGATEILECFSVLQADTSYLRRVFEFLDTPNLMQQGNLTVKECPDQDYEIEFRNVSFRYPGSEIYALKDVSLKFQAGKRLAVVGMNGSGKTTFIKLLCRLYDPTEGEILLNGIDIRKYNYADYLSIFSVVFQDFHLFAYQLGQNVAGQMDYNSGKVKDCLRKSGFDQRLSRLPHGLDTYLYKNFVQEGVNISGGEAQKIALARALYKDAHFIILDEPTAALDPIAEAEIYSKFNDIADNKTAIYISHRLSSCRFCDEILVFDQGHLVQQGSHNHLVEDKTGKYHQLWQAQAQYYTR